MFVSNYRMSILFVLFSIIILKSSLLTSGTNDSAIISELQLVEYRRLLRQVESIMGIMDSFVEDEFRQSKVAFKKDVETLQEHGSQTVNLMKKISIERISCEYKKQCAWELIPLVQNSSSEKQNTINSTFNFYKSAYWVAIRVTEEEFDNFKQDAEKVMSHVKKCNDAFLGFWCYDDVLYKIEPLKNKGVKALDTHKSSHSDLLDVRRKCYENIYREVRHYKLDIKSYESQASNC